MIKIKRLFQQKWAWFVALLLSSSVLLTLPFVFGPPSEDLSPSALAWYDFIGSFHPLVLHLPIGFLLLIFCLEAWILFTKEQRLSMTVPLVLNALVAVQAAVVGFIWYQTGQWQGEAMEDHLWQGLAFAAFAIWLPWVYLIVKENRISLYYGFLLLTIGVMTSAAHIGGESVHGDVMDKAPWLIEIEGESESESEEAAATKEDPVVYQDLVVPILADKCYSCHSEKRQKGGLRLDTIAFMLEGGNEWDSALVKGHAEESPIYTTLTLPLEDEMRMPPKSRTQVTKDERAIIRWWINLGAPEFETLSEVKIPEEIATILGAPTEEVEVEEIEADLVTADPDLLIKFDQFQARYPHSLQWTSQEKQGLRFSAASMRKSYQDEDLAALFPFAPLLEELDFNGSGISDDVADLVIAATNLHTLKLAETAITDDLPELIQDHPTLARLILHRTRLTDDSVDALAEMTQLKSLFIWDTLISEEEAEYLQEELSSTQVDAGLADIRTIKAFQNETFTPSGAPYEGPMKLLLSSRYKDDSSKDALFLNPNYKGKNGFNLHTKLEDQPFAVVQFEKPIFLEGIVLQNRDKLQERANSLEVLTSTDLHTWEVAHTPNGRVVNQWKIKVGKPARFVKLRLRFPQQQFLNLKNIAFYLGDPSQED